MTNGFDSYFLRLMGYYAHASPVADRFICKFLFLTSVKLLPLVACLWGIWFAEDNRQENRQTATRGMVGVFAALAVARLMQNLLPERVRPIHSGNPDFVAPFGSNSDVLEHWSSFPSDHAAISFALSTVIFRVSKPLGVASYIWSTFIICLPRLYTGMHYASDILAGAIIGVVTVLLAVSVMPIPAKMTAQMLSLQKRYSGVLYATLFILSYQVVIMFDDIRTTAMAVLNVLQG